MMLQCSYIEYVKHLAPRQGSEKDKRKEMADKDERAKKVWFIIMNVIG